MLDSIEEIVVCVNERLNAGGTIVGIEKELGYGKDALRKKLNRHGYKYNKQKRKFEFINNTNVTLNNKKNNSRNERKEFNVFTQEEILILKKIIKSYSRINIDESYINSEVVTRSFRTYKKAIDEFANFCKNNNLSQKDAVAQALMDFINK